MAANPKPLPEQYHVYHAEAFVLEGDLEHPIKQPIEKYGRAVLEHTRRESLITQSVGETNVEGLISFKRGYTRVAGAHVDKNTDVFGNDHAGWVTLSSAVLEGYNVEDIVTADRVVAQLSTQHSIVNGHVPRVNFIGTRFENLRIGGYPVEVTLDLAFCGAKPEGNRSYLKDDGFLDRVHRQLDKIVEASELPQDLTKKYAAEIQYIDDLKRRVKDDANGDQTSYPKLRCSLIEKITLPVKIPGVQTFGNAIFIRDFGTVYLAELEVGTRNSHSDFRHRKGDGARTQPSDSHYFTLNMLDIQLGCPATGAAKGPSVTGNGQTKP